MIPPRLIFPVVLSLIGATPIMAQTTPQTTPEPDIQDTVPPPALVEILTAAKNITELPVNEAVRLDMSLLNVPGGANDLASGVTVNAYGRSVQLQGRKIGQLVLTGVSKGRKTEVLNSTAFTSQFDLGDDAKLQPDRQIKVMGNASELIAALQRLQKEPEGKPEKKERKTVSNDTPQSSSTGESRNRDAAGYSSPQVTKTGKKDPVESTRVSQDGCKIEIKLAQGVARETAKLITTKGGAVTKESKCAPSGTDYKIRKSYPSCAKDKVDLRAMKVTARYINYYLDSSGKRSDIGECRDDPELVFDIFEKHSCPVKPDYAGQKVIFQSKLVYTNQNNREIEVRDCAPSTEKPPVPMVKTTEGCSVREDGAHHKSFRQSVWVYTDAGNRHRIGSCQDDGVSYANSRDGCGIEINLAQGLARETEKRITYKDGAVIKESKCTPSGTDYKIRKSYPSCADDTINLKDKKAKARYIHYYLDGDGKREDIGECRDDPEQVFDIVEKHNCMVSPDYAAQKVIFQSKLIYTNQNNREIEVRDCAPSTEKPAVPMVKSTAGCSIRHDFAKSKSFRQSMWVYTDAGLRYQIGSCVDDGTVYDQKKIYKDDSGKYICNIINNGSTVTLQHRKRITVSKLHRFVTECTPDATGIKVSSTTQGCDDPAGWTHNLSSGQSIAKARYYFVQDDKRVSLGGCRDSTTTYAHQVAVTGYQNNDAKRSALPKSTVSINPPSGRYYIVRNHVLAGATQIGYTYQRQDIVPNGSATYDGCHKLQNRNRVKTWKRPDNSFYYETVGAAPATRTDACQTELSGWRFVLGRRRCDIHYYNRGEDSVYRIYESCTYSITRSVRRDDGWLMSGPTTRSATISDTVNSWTHSCVLVPRCEATPDATWAAARLSEWGW